MTLGQAKSLLHQSTENDILLGVFPHYVNSASKQIQQRRSWFGMQRTITVTIEAGDSSVALPENYKEPQRGKNPLRATDTQDAAGFSLWTLYSKQEAKRLAHMAGGGGWIGERAAYIDYDGDEDAWVLYIEIAAQQDIIFDLDAYVFMDDVVDDNDSNYLMRQYDQLVLEKAKELIYNIEMEQPDKAALCEKRFEKEFLRCSADDASRAVSGRNLRMGGA